MLFIINSERLIPLGEIKKKEDMYTMPVCIYKEDNLHQRQYKNGQGIRILGLVQKQISSSISK